MAMIDRIKKVKSEAENAHTQEVIAYNLKRIDKAASEGAFHVECNGTDNYGSIYDSLISDGYSVELKYDYYGGEDSAQSCHRWLLVDWSEPKKTKRAYESYQVAKKVERRIISDFRKNVMPRIEMIITKLAEDRAYNEKVEWELGEIEANELIKEGLKVSHNQSECMRKSYNEPYKRTIEWKGI